MSFLRDLLWIYLLILAARAILSWFPDLPPAGRKAFRLTYAATEPVLAPVRKMLPSTGPVDLSLTIVWLVILVLIEIL